jgi:cytochrome bd-type quinol oxidase subunit 1
MSVDPLLLSRIQFAWVVAWHFLLPAFTVGLASFLAVLSTASISASAFSTASRPAATHAIW